MAAVRSGFAAVAMVLAVAPAFASAPATQMQGAESTGAQARVAFSEGSMRGEHAIRVFDAQGKLVRDLALAEFLGKDYIAALPSDATGLHWQRGTRRAADAVEFDVAIPGDGAPLHFSVGLADGLVRTAQIREYLAATDRARAAAAASATVAGSAPAAP